MTSLVSGMPGQNVEPPVTLVWIDARQAVVARWERGSVQVERIAGELPPHDRTVGHTRRNPLIRHGGGQPQTRLDHRRQEAEHAYLEAVTAHVAGDGAVEVIGSGPMRHHLARRLRAQARPGVPRPVHTAPADQLTEAQIVARLRELAGHPPARQSSAR